MNREDERGKGREKEGSWGVKHAPFYLQDTPSPPPPTALEIHLPGNRKFQHGAWGSCVIGEREGRPRKVKEEIQTVEIGIVTYKHDTSWLGSLQFPPQVREEIGLGFFHNFRHFNRNRAHVAVL